MRLLTKMAGVPGRFLEHVKWAQIATEDHPETVMRAAELLRWVESGEYEAVLNRATSDKVHKVTNAGTTACRTCGHQLEGAEKFCPTCGGALTN